ncbi:hypothetical protein BY458DRAFT_459125 [Sporodiniella umbellata]|nr:hypothetical protein BY458DRAFT_459125 [Sporodiniella umbellata]
MFVKDLVFVISGGASGLGAAAVQAIISEGGFAAIFDVNKEKGDQLSSEHGANICYFPGPVDITSESQVEEALKKTQDHFSGKVIAGAILAGGIFFPTPSQGYGPDKNLTSYAQFKSIIDVNLLGTYCVAQKVSEILIKNEPLNEDGERGVIITVSSILGLDHAMLSYGTSKAGIVGFTLPLANELSPFGVRVMCIAPGGFDTPMVAKIGAGEESYPPFPHRFGQSKEFADLALSIIKMPMLNGSVIRLDGAYRAKA